MSTRRPPADRRRPEPVAPPDAGDASVSDRWRALVEHAAVGLARVDLDGRFIEVTPRFAAIAGHPPTSLHGRRFQEITHPDDLDADLRQVADLLDGRIERYAIDKRYLRADGTPVWVNLTVGLVRGPGGRPVEFVSAIVDVDARKRTEARLQRSETMLDQGVRVAGLGVFEHDVDSGQVTASPTLHALLGRDPRTPLTVAEYARGVHPDDREAFAASVARARDPAGDGSGASDHRWVLADGTVRWLQLRSSTAFTGEGAARRPTRTIGAIRDTTRERETEAHRDEFLATLAHELRNPLAPMLTAARVIARLDALPDDGRRALAMIERQARHMTRLVEDLLEATRITQGMIVLRPEPVAVHDAIEVAVESLAPAFAAKRQRVALRLRPVPRLSADPVRLAQVLENLLNNACKYTHEGGSVTVGARTPDDGGWVEIRVTDDGIGLAPDQLGRVFEMFVQAEPGLGDRQGGLGIGLAMVRRLVELHGGTVRAESDGPGRGASFVVCWPAHRDGGPAPDQGR